MTDKSTRWTVDLATGFDTCRFFSRMVKKFCPIISMIGDEKKIIVSEVFVFFPFDDDQANIVLIIELKLKIELL